MPAAATALRVLVVEDDQLLQNIYRETFLTWSLPLDVHVMDHGLDALVEVGREPPDLLIADLRIPGIDGFEMIRRLRDNPLVERHRDRRGVRARTQGDRRGGRPAARTSRCIASPSPSTSCTATSRR